MGIRNIPLTDVSDAVTPSSVPEDHFLHQDVVDTLRWDGSLYRLPQLNEEGALVYHGDFVKAAREAGLSHMRMEVPGDHFEPPEESTTSNRYVFFDQPVFSRAHQPALVRAAVAQLIGYFHEEGVAALKHPTITYDPSLEVRFDVARDDVVLVQVEGQFKNPEHKSFLQRPSELLFDRLDTEIGDIRSVNGIAYLPQTD